MRVKAALPLGIAASVGLLAIEVLSGGPWRSLTRPSNVSTADTGYATLQFVDERGITRWVPAGGNLNLKMRVGNSSGADAHYNVVVMLTAATDPSHRASQRHSLTVAPGQAADVESTLPVPNCAGRMRADVRLEGREEAVHIWVWAQQTSREVPSCG